MGGAADVVEQCDQVVQLGALEDVAGGVLLVVGPVLVVGPGEDHDLGAGHHLAHPGEHVAPGQVGQPQVEQDDVGPDPGGQLDGLQPGARLAHDLEATVEPQRDAHQPAHVRDVVDQQHPDGHGVAVAPGSRTVNAFASGA